MSNEKQKYLLLFSSGLREERKRIKITQEEISKHLKLSLMTWGKYERGITLPGAYILSKLSKFGFDVSYIVTGEIKPCSLSANEEEKIIRQYRKADEKIKFVVRSIFDAFKL